MIIKIDDRLAVNPDKVVKVSQKDNKVSLLIEVGKSYDTIYTDVSYRKVIALLNGKEY